MLVQAAMPGYSAPIVKAEAAEEEVDYGAPEGPPLRAMADYGDLVDDENPVSGGGAKDTKEEDGPKGALGPPRRDAIHVSGVQRLTRTHLAEVFDSKKLPQFRWVEWLEDDQVLCVFDTPEDAAVALRSCEAGFGDIAVEDVRPGPGLWRAQRYMLDFRMATQEDRPDPEFKKKHRGGQQVREYRFWEAMKDADKNILGEDEVQGLKRAAPSGEDAFAAADWDDDAQRRKRLRHGAHPGDDDEEEGDIDLLSRMAQQDKLILTKEEDGKSTSLPKVNDEPLANVTFDDKDKSTEWSEWPEWPEWSGHRGWKRRKAWRW